MRIKRRIAGRASVAGSERFAELGFTVSSEGFFVFWLDESDPRWPRVLEWSKTEDGPLVDISTTDFTKAELVGAESLRMAADWHWSFPQPDEGSFGYRSVTYDDSGACKKCWVGLRQVAPFQFVGEPRWGRRNVLQLNWVFDELFVTPELWDSVFRPFGVAAREVHNRKGAVLGTVVQLVVDETVDLDMDGYAFHTCEVCGVRKWSPVSRGFHPRPVTEPVAAMCRSNQWFGSGGQAQQALLVSQELYAAIQTAKAKGARFVACAPRWGG